MAENTCSSKGDGSSYAVKRSSIQCGWSSSICRYGRWVIVGIGQGIFDAVQQDIKNKTYPSSNKEAIAQNSSTYVVNGVERPTEREFKESNRFKDKVKDLSDANINDLDRLPQDVIDKNGGEDFTQELKKEGGKSKSDLYWDKEGNIYTVPKKGGPPQWMDG